MSILNENIRFLREKKKLSQTDLAEKLGLNRGNIDSYEKNTNPKPEMLTRIADFFRIDLQNLLTVKVNDYNYKELTGERAKVMLEPRGAYFSKSRIIDLIYQIAHEPEEAKRKELSESAVSLAARLMDENNQLRNDLLEYLKDKLNET